MRLIKLVSLIEEATFKSDHRDTNRVRKKIPEDLVFFKYLVIDISLLVNQQRFRCNSVTCLKFLGELYEERYRYQCRLCCHILLSSSWKL
mmetsp:Transcript_16004/g.37073  ORF Transcript_16004/g.37073 Transcript_16004/m.37073 type:complete len:90 (-) Transcript_16004:2004-2273(-)